MRTSILTLLFLSACLSTSPEADSDASPSTAPTADADADADNGSINLFGGRSGSDAPIVGRDGSVEPTDGGSVDAGSTTDAPDATVDSSDAASQATCYLFADTFDRPDGPVGDAEYPAGATWPEQVMVLWPTISLVPSGYVIANGKLVAPEAKASLEVALPESSGNDIRVRWAVRPGSQLVEVHLKGNGSLVLETGITTIASASGMGEFYVNDTYYLTVDPTGKYYVEIVIQGSTISGSLSTGAYASEGGVEVVAHTPRDIGSFTYDAVSVFLGNGASLDEVFIEKYPCP